MPDALLEAVSLTNHYRDLVAVDGLDLAVRSGECYGRRERESRGSPLRRTGTSSRRRSPLYTSCLILMASFH